MTASSPPNDSTRVVATLVGGASVLSLAATGLDLPPGLGFASGALAALGAFWLAARSRPASATGGDGVIEAAAEGVRRDIRSEERRVGKEC